MVKNKTKYQSKTKKQKMFALLKILGLVIALVFGVMLVLPSIFSDEIEDIIEQKANDSLTSELNFSSTDVTFFRHFPSLTFSFDGVSLKETGLKAPNDLLTAQEIYFKINILKLVFENEVKINGIAIDKANFNFKTDKFGQSNYNVYKTANTTDTVSTKESNLFLEIDEFTIKNSHLQFDDQSTKIRVKAEDFNLEGDGSFIQKDVFLKTKFTSENFVLHYDDVQYITNKKVDADLQTKFNSEELRFKFDKNIIYIKALPVFFNGEFSILKQGYFVDFDVNVEDTDWTDIFSAFPSKYENWTKQTKISGNTNANFKLKGYYRPVKNENLDLDITFNTAKASLNYELVDERIKDIYVDAILHIPELDITRMDIFIEKFQFGIKDETLKGTFINKHDENGLYVNSEIKGVLNLSNFSKAIGIDGLDLSGLMNVDVTSQGYYNPETLNFPKSQAKLLVKNASFKTLFTRIL